MANVVFQIQIIAQSNLRKADLSCVEKNICSKIFNIDFLKLST